MLQNLNLNFQIKVLRESGISHFQKKVRFGVKTLIWALIYGIGLIVLILFALKLCHLFLLFHVVFLSFIICFWPFQIPLFIFLLPATSSSLPILYHLCHYLIVGRNGSVKDLTNWIVAITFPMACWTFVLKMLSPGELHTEHTTVLEQTSLKQTKKSD